MIDSSNRLNANLIHDGTISNTEFGYLNGVTSNIQTQLNNIVNLKAPIDNPSFTGNVGIGTTNPDKTLHLYGSSRVDIKFETDGDKAHFIRKRWRLFKI